MNKVLVVSLLAGLATSGCATVHQTYTQDGREGFTLNCSGWARGWDKCYEAAGEKCGSKGYEVLNKSSEDMVAVGGSAGGFGGGKTNERSMTVACKK